jgi:hypothetical protein
VDAGLTVGYNNVIVTSGIQIHYQGLSARAAWPKHRVSPSLTDSEWAVWKDNYPLSAATPAAEQAGLEYMTGRVPLY